MSWTEKLNWQLDKKTNSYKYVSETNVSDLGCKENSSLKFPNIMHSSQRVFVDGLLVAMFGSENPGYTLTIYGGPIAPCEIILQGNVVRWEVYSPFQYFAKTRDLPEVTANNSPINLSDVANLAITGTLLVFMLFLLAAPKKSNLHKQSIRLAFFSLFMAGFFISSVSGFFGINFEHLLLDKIACVFLGLSTICFVDFLRTRNLIGTKVGYSLATVSLLGTLPILFINNGDTIQIFLNVIFGPAIIAVWIPFFIEVKKTIINRKLQLEFQNAALLCFTVATTSDILYTEGVHNLGFSLGYGVFGTVLFFTSAIQKDIQSTYKRLEYLQQNLQLEVEKKTNELSTALSELKSTQAELIQKEKMASLGTLSAGIAHEINNSINYVNACLEGLRRSIAKVVPVESSEYTKIKKLIDTIKHGTQVTIDIVSSLRNYSGLNQAKMKKVLLQEIVESVLTIVKSKLSNVKVSQKIPEDLEIFCSIVGVNQVFMNLVTNAVDAMESIENPEITIAAKNDEQGVVIVFQDNGSGIPEDLKSRIFDPFFTTKEVGKGTGLGLFIIRKEIEENHGGSISIDSDDHGTRFTIFIPQKEVVDQSLLEAA